MCCKQFVSGALVTIEGIRHLRNIKPNSVVSVHMTETTLVGGAYTFKD
jgi:hypothetical protein